MTSGSCAGYVQANVTIIPEANAADFEAFCRANPKPCPLLEVCRGREAVVYAPGSDIASDIPQYCIYHNGVEIEKRDNIVDLW
jgi:uncharacterized protein YcsI (UPF0317 family)